MLKGHTIYIRPLETEDAEENLRLQSENRAFFEQFSMIRADDYYTIEGQRKRIEQYQQRLENDQEYHFGIFTNKDHTLIGTVSLFQIIRGALQCAFIGYFLDKAHNGKGLMTEAVRLIVDYAFYDLKLHRIEAGVMPRNLGSMRVLEKAGFHKEGIARKNVKINGKWEDHQVLAILNPDDEK
ncbi:RimJ/RimL family protein N-acetyltransferase [Bacillus halotolerans]|uniref:GNAT family N-acetyltransferase n=1 Tax=Bacillus halotolerans TaxID=260554 RepID=UPI000D01F836|nr:GNAT family protein [Bacillus halotolerans]MDP4523571.1 GNAT family protein [Bacillus halotolerans]MEC1605774.1 GNAT family protein [Bacillus halotolerans]PRP53014.1 RimJ/RimL family protein N-acetyltransferase [Bacillus halotolerans]PRP58235.1 RimJ/RimL family protein N-acetyltransferase [Bacillus halotolerans]PRP62439.1 RimJ/RimL family protein N-acetyltransferase [Bacillus halotolerans]